VEVDFRFIIYLCLVSFDFNDASMNQEFENQRILTNALREQLQSMRNEEKRLQQRIRLVEARLIVQELRERIMGKGEALSQLRSKVGELESRLVSPSPTL
jgi:vacuolar-type H+-ATPase subunit E/Vma4